MRYFNTFHYWVRSYCNRKQTKRKNCGLNSITFILVNMYCSCFSCVLLCFPYSFVNLETSRYWNTGFIPITLYVLESSQNIAMDLLPPVFFITSPGCMWISGYPATPPWEWVHVPICAATGSGTTKKWFWLVGILWLNNRNFTVTWCFEYRRVWVLYLILRPTRVSRGW